VSSKQPLATAVHFLSIYSDYDTDTDSDSDYEAEADAEGDLTTNHY
jgi:hypothetical protein